MAVLSYSPTRSDGWSAAVEINFTAVYDPATNQTTVTFSESSLAYFGRKDYGTTAETTITVTAEDNPASTATATLSTAGTTNGGTRTFTGLPSPAKCVVRHGNASPGKKIKIAGSSSISVYPWSSSADMYVISGSGSTSLTVYTAPAYKLTLANTGVDLAAKLLSSFFRSAGSALSNGSAIYPGETVEITFAAATGYENPSCSVSGLGGVASGGSFSVSGNHTVTATATVKSYTLTIAADGHGEVTVKRGTEILRSGATVRHFQVLTVTVSAKTGYEISAADVNGTAISPDTAVNHTVSGPVTVTVLTQALSNLLIDDGGRKRLLALIDSGGKRKTYRMIMR